MRLTWAGIITLTVVLLFGFIAPGVAPVSVTTPISDSMEPTAPQHALVVITDTDAEVGDILLFESAQRDNPVLHRAIRTVETETGTGYVTQGDANELPDQTFGTAPVTEDRIDGVVPVVAGYPVIIPYVGGVLTNPVVLVGMCGLLALSLLYTTQVSNGVRDEVVTIPIRNYAIVFAILLVIGLPAVTALSAIPVQTEIVTSTTVSPDSAGIAAPGEVSEQTITATSPFFAVLHLAAVVDGDLRLQDTTSPIGEQTAEFRVQNPPSDEPTAHQGTVWIYTYPSVLPGVVIQPLDAIHPVLASAVNAVIFAGVILVVSFLFDKHRIVRVGPDKLRNHRNNRPQRRNK